MTDRAPRRARLNRGRLVQVAIAIADEEGLSSMTMRRLARDLGVTVAALYRHVPGRAELLAAMRESVEGTPGDGQSVDDGWRVRFRALAQRDWSLCRKHPWLLEVPEPTGGAGSPVVQRYVRVCADLGLTCAEFGALPGVLHGYARGMAAQARSGDDPASQDLLGTFAFGLERLLDGIGVLLVEAGRSAA